MEDFIPEKKLVATSLEAKDSEAELNRLREQETREQMVSSSDGQFLAWRPKMAEKFSDRIVAGTSALGIQNTETDTSLRITSKKDRFASEFSEDELTDDSEELNSSRRKFRAGRALGRLLRALGPYKIDTHNIVMTSLVHGNKIVKVDNNYLLSNKNELAQKEADGLVTNLTTDKVVLMTLNADCPSVTMFAPDVNAIGLAHCGWKSLRADIVPELIKTLHNEYSADISSLQVSVSPGAGELEYEVGEDVYNSFVSQDPKFTQAFVETNLQTGKGEKKFIFNLNKIIELKVLKAGIKPETFEASRLNSIDSDFFASQRRQGDSRSTNVSLAGLLK